jgi:hypothetical protein
MGTVDDEAAALYEAAMTLSRRALAGRHYAVAYHELAAALHAAFDLSDDERLKAVDEECVEQTMWLNDHDPDHELSARSAAGRGTRSLWEMLREDAQRRRQILDRYRRLQQMRSNADT